MQYRVFAVPATGSPDLEEALNHFLRSKRIVSVQKSLQEVDGAARWCFCVEYLEGALAGDQKASGRSKRIDYKEVLSEEDFLVFVRLRDARKELATAEAIPVYAVCTNEQLAQMAIRRPSSLSELRAIEGIGDAKAAKYGAALLAALNGKGANTDETCLEPD